ncbi:gfo/Idh/MocA family oxidoreductase [bacterium]|nr:gfo/Idh/MocA family oxidoreductase [bacterium]
MQPIRFALIGAGNIAKIYLDAFSKIADAQVTVICNRTESTGRPLAAQAGAAWTADIADAVTREDVDAVVIATPSGTHAEIAIAAAQAGKHLLVEKPIDITLPRVDSIIAAAEDAGVILACVFPLRFAAGVAKVKEAVDAGRLGRITLADCYVKWFRPQSYYDGSWRGTWKLDGGGALMNQSIHNIDLLQYLAGPVKNVFGRTATLAHEMQTEDTASAVLTFANGALGVIQGATSCWPGDPARVELHGDRGTIVIEEGQIAKWDLQDASDEEKQAMLTLEKQDGSGAADPMAIGSEKHRRQIVDLIDAIRTGRPPAIQGAEARRSVEIIRAIYTSSQEGRVVTLDE